MFNKTFLLLFVLLLQYVHAETEKALPYDGWERTSLYVPARDGTRLALDYYRPTKNGTLHVEPLPVIWRFTPYGRYPGNADLEPNGLPENSQGTINGRRVLETYLRNGYVVAQADVRGTGASFGVSKFMQSSQEWRDAADITEWLAGQPFTTDKVGMAGLSYLGSLLFKTMAEKPKSLKAVFSQNGTVDVYEAFYQNGIPRMQLPFVWRQVRTSLDYGQVGRVDKDKDGSLLEKAVIEHYWNTDVGGQISLMPHYDSPDPVFGKLYWQDANSWNRVADIEQSSVAIYHFTGWFDGAARNQATLFANLNNPQKLHLGPYYHRDVFGIDIAEESLRWFDYWLKGTDNGIMEEPRVRYFVTGDEIEAGWKTSDQWPLEQEQRQNWYLKRGPSGSIASVNDGILATGKPVVSGNKDQYTIDYDITLGAYVDRNNGAVSEERETECARKIEVPITCYAHSGYADLSGRYDARALTYTSEALSEDIVITGHPAVHLWVSSSLKDIDLYATLSEVEGDGTSRLVSDNAIRASHRKLANAPYNNLGLPWQSNLQKDQAMLPKGKAIRISLTLKPVANRFDRGNRIRLVIAAADAHANPLPEDKNPGTITVHSGRKHLSSLELPVVPE